ncbi:hypothetical protein TREMEDRAFT_72846 [Tremella mesenterica DSM 1558]|uniref:uncharacterized protein n=1 Tax=Tremella mesenterica (strain ATCC 24925 / CBS 8224 / DSM 1558 / NBRC 9311 / NRRL Y-6157 / RJB 2259-6 / UBC 559-6) TaxID=578456 RepID=UPI0003F49FD2|nr:uncharacterized protein TREMEDRAFT_72846 [Tremella mesenterica DSM 1558]EIW72686.1 hypothetical protein TREMEDRAFT_72846 [Tremella mesenterica DSM 1558]
MTVNASPKHPAGLPALPHQTLSDTDVRKGENKVDLGHDALDLAETNEASAKQVADRLEIKRLENERARVAQRKKFEEQMRQMEAHHAAEESQLATDSPPGEAASAPTTPPGGGHSRVTFGSTVSVPDIAKVKEAQAPIGTGRDLNGVRSVPASRRTSGYGGASFGFEKLSLSVMESSKKDWAEDEDVDAEGAQNSVKYLGMNDDDPFPGLPKKDPRMLSASSAALDLAPLSQTPPRAFGARPFETSIKTSDWPNFPGAHPTRGMTSPLPAQTNGADVIAQDPIFNASRKASPTGMADSVASLPAISSKSVPGTPFGLGPSMGGVKRSGTSPNMESLAQNQRGYSNPDLARAFGRTGSGFSLQDNARPYGADPLYGMFVPNTAPLPLNSAIAAAFVPGAYDNYGFDDDGYGSGALYPGGSIGLKNKRADADREFNRFAGVRIEDLQGELLMLCKDQHGCRYLQRKLEEGDAGHRDMIFLETYGHFPELMTDPFGNYLCQKLLEYSTDEQRSAIIDSVANDLVAISLNMHGTRAVQKMVDFLSAPRQAKQIRTLIYALSMNVVALIKDLNGNHVIQKCLNKLCPEDNQFIYNAIAANLIEVATHRHGCCVLQRSIDHASPAQRMQLVTEIIFNSLYLVQDPFGNYVIQYILDLNDARFSEPLIRTFIGNVCSLSVQKFSSNVVEKCIRVADPEVRKSLVSEVLNRSRLEKLLRDSYGNYVIQTILDYCELSQRMVLVECIRPILPSIRNTPYGKRIQSKLAREEVSAVYGGYRNGATNGFSPRGGYQRHLGRPQLQHINALTEVYGSQGGPFIAPPFGMGYGRDPMTPPSTHNGMPYHAPGPDGMPWLHLRGQPGQPTSNWGGMPEGNGGGQDPNQMMSTTADGATQQMEGMGQMPMWNEGQYMPPYLNGQMPMM